MSQEELVSAYAEGEISRRTLIRRLVAGGVSLGAATAYAHLITPKAQARAGSGPNEYPVVHLKILDDALGKVINTKQLNVKVRSADPCDLRLRVKLGANLLGTRNVHFGTAGSKTVAIDLDTVAPLRNRNRAKVKVFAISEEGAIDPEVARTRKVLVK